MKYLILYFILWLVTSIFFFWKTGSFGVAGLVLVSYTFSALVSVLFNGTFYIESDISAAPILFLYLCILVSIFPVLWFSKRAGSCKFRLNGKEKLVIFYFLIISAPIVMEATFELLLVSSDTNTSQLGAIYDLAGDVIGEQLSMVGRKTLAFVHLFRFVWPVLLFAVLSSKGLPNYLALIPALAILADIMENFAGASRVAIVRDIMMLALAYLMFKPSLSLKSAKVVKRLLFAGFAVFALGLMLITVSRFENGGTTSVSLITWLGLYIGEAPIRFSDNVWSLDMHTGGDYCFSIFRKFLGFDAITDLAARDDYYSGKLGIPVNIFYTFMGDVVIDFGKAGAAAFAVLLSLLLFYLYSGIKKRGYFSLASAFALSTVYLLFEFGFMYFVFKNYQLQKDLLMLTAAMVVFVVSTRCTGKRKRKLKMTK